MTSKKNWNISRENKNFNSCMQETKISLERDPILIKVKIMVTILLETQLEKVLITNKDKITITPNKMKKEDSLEKKRVKKWKK